MAYTLNATSSNDQSAILPPKVTTGRKTLEQVLAQKPYEIPDRFSGKNYDVEQSIIAINYTNQPWQCFLYKGRVPEGQLENRTPYKHFFVPRLGGSDVVPISNKWTVQFQLFVDAVDNHQSSDTSFDPADYEIESYGTYDIKWDQNNQVSITKGDDVGSPDPQTFYFKFLTSDVNWKWTLKLFCDLQLISVVSSKDVGCKPYVKSRLGALNQDKVSTMIVPIKVEEEFTAVLVLSDNAPKKTTDMIYQENGNSYYRYSGLSLIAPGQTYLITVEEEDSNAAVTDVLWTKKIMRATPNVNSQKPPKGYGQF